MIIITTKDQLDDDEDVILLLSSNNILFSLNVCLSVVRVGNLLGPRLHITQKGIKNLGITTQLPNHTQHNHAERKPTGVALVSHTISTGSWQDKAVWGTFYWPMIVSPGIILIFG